MPKRAPVTERPEYVSDVEAAAIEICIEAVRRNGGRCLNSLQSRRVPPPCPSFCPFLNS